MLRVLVVLGIQASISGNDLKRLDVKEVQLTLFGPMIRCDNILLAKSRIILFDLWLVWSNSRSSGLVKALLSAYSLFCPGSKI